MLSDLLTHIYSRPARDQVWLAVGLTVVAGVALLIVAYAVISMLTGEYEELSERRSYLGNLETIITSADAIPEASPVADRADIFFTGRSKEVVAASLQTWFGQEAGDLGIELESVEPASISDPDDQPSVGLNVVFSGPWKAIQALILKVETAKPKLFIRDLEIRLTSYEQELRREPNLSVRISFAGALRTPNAE